MTLLVRSTIRERDRHQPATRRASLSPLIHTEATEIYPLGTFGFTLDPMTPYLLPLGLLVVANVFMTFAWYGHLQTMVQRPLWLVILVSWAIAFFEYCFQVPANRLGYGLLTLGQLKVSQEVITMLVFMVFSALYMKKPVSLDLVYATLCLAGAAYFVFRGGVGDGGAVSAGSVGVRG